MQPAKHFALVNLDRRNKQIIYRIENSKIFKVVKKETFQLKFLDIFLIFAQNIDCGDTLEPPRRGGSNEYPKSMF